MPLMRISQYIKQHFEEGSRPCTSTVIGMIKRGELYGEKRGIWYVDPEVPTISNREMMELTPIDVDVEPVNDVAAKLLAGIGR